MKRIILIGCTILALVGAYKYESTYKLTNCIVTDTTPTGALIMDSNGDEWYVEENNLRKHQTVSMIINHNYTYNDNTDDEIIRVGY